MGIFKKQKPPIEPTGRRRPVPVGQSSQRTQAFSYYAQRSTPEVNIGRGQPSETANGQLGRPWYLSRPVTGFFGLLALFGLCAFFNLSTSPKIVPLTSGGSSYFLHDTAVYQTAAAQALGSSLFNHSKLTVDTAKVSQVLRTKYPEIHSATMTVPLFGSRPIIYITPYRPSFVLSTLDNQAFLLDENGRALALTSQIDNMGELSVPTLQDKSGLSIHLGSQALPAGTVQFAKQVTQILDAAKIRYQALMLPAGTSELDVYITGTSYFVKFNLQGDPDQQTGTFLAAQQRLEQDKTPPLQYIDVRVPERAYYK